MGEFRRTTPGTGIWVDPGAAIIPGTSTKYGDVFSNLTPRFELNATATDRYNGNIPSILDPAGDYGAFVDGLTDYARDKEISDNFVLQAEVSDCDLEGWEFEIIARDMETCAPITDEQPVKSLYGTCRSDDEPQFEDLGGFFFTCQGEQVEEIHEFAPAEYFGGNSRIQVNYVFPYQFSNFLPGGGEWRKVNCGPLYMPEDPQEMPIPPPEIPHLPGNIGNIPEPPRGQQGPQGTPGAAGADGQPGATPVFLYGQIEKSLIPGYVDIQPRPLEPMDPRYGTPNAYKLVGFIDCPCVDGAPGAPGAKGDDGEQGPQGEPGEQGPEGVPGMDHLEPYHVDYYYRDPTTDEPVRRIATIKVPATTDDDTGPLYNEILFMLQLILKALKPAGEPGLVEIEIEDLITDVGVG